MTMETGLSIDWLSISVQPTPTADVDVDQVVLATSLAVGCEPGDWTLLEIGKYGYRQAMLGPAGAQIWWDSPGRDDIHITLPGQACQVAGEKRLRSFIKYALAHGGKASRCDVNMDDYRRLIEPAAALVEIQGPNAVTHARAWTVIHGGEVGAEDVTGITLMVGAPSSRQRLRIYDKGMESDGELDCVRWELQARKQAAETLVQQLAAAEWATVIRARMMAFIDFRDADSHSETEKRVRLTWWEKLMLGVKKGRVYLPKPLKTIDEVHSWLRDSIGPSLALVMAALDGDLGFVTSIVDYGRVRWKPRHRAMLAQLV